MLASIARRTPVVYRKIGLTPPDVISGLKRATHGYLMRRTSRIVAVGESVRREAMEAFRVSPERVITIANAVDPGRMKMVRGSEATRRALGIPPNSRVILSLGALTWEKDPLAHVEIGARVLRLLPEAVHLMVGDGPLLAEVETSIRRRRMNGRVRLLPATRNVPDLLGMSDVLLLASRTEGMPACLIEAGMMGIPVAAYAIAGVPEVVVDGVTGRLTSAGDMEGLAANVVELLADPKTSKSLGASAREYCRLRFDIREIAPRYLKLYKELEAS
jgi:glycosyltransferase involved in cell wall biosynthesis